jgi:hypothetical protein
MGHTKKRFKKRKNWGAVWLSYVRLSYIRLGWARLGLDKARLG